MKINRTIFICCHVLVTFGSASEQDVRPVAHGLVSPAVRKVLVDSSWMRGPL